MRDYENRLLAATMTAQPGVAPHLRLVQRSDLLLVLKRVERLERQLDNAKARLEKKKAPR